MVNRVYMVPPHHHHSMDLGPSMDLDHDDDDDVVVESRSTIEYCIQTFQKSDIDDSFQVFDSHCFHLVLVSLHQESGCWRHHHHDHHHHLRDESVLLSTSTTTQPPSANLARIVSSWQCASYKQPQDSLLDNGPRLFLCERMQEAS